MEPQHSKHSDARYVIHSKYSAAAFMLNKNKCKMHK